MENNEIINNDKLLSLINEAAVRLLSIEPDEFETALNESMENMGKCLDVDAISIWRANETDKDNPFYTIIYSWFLRNEDKVKNFNSISGSNMVSFMSDWDGRLNNDKGYLAVLTSDFDEAIRSIMEVSGIKAIMAFPVFFRGKYWGFVSFENRHSEKLCSEKEMPILKSGSLLLANAVERNESMIQLNERLAQQQLMSDISKSFITKEPMDNLIKNALEKIGTFLNVNRVIIAVFEKNSDISRPAYFWFSDPKYTPTESQKGFSSIIRDLFPRYHEDNGDNLSMYCNNTLTHKDERYKLFHEKGGLKSFMCIPIYVDEELWGTMSVEEHVKFRQWSESDGILINTLSNAISNAVMRDVMEHEREEALEKAIQASHSKGDFLANMSHEIRTPMNAIIGMTTIGTTSQTLDKKDYAFGKIEDASKHLLGIINDILDMSKIEANKLELSPINFGFEKMLQKVVNFINFKVDERRQNLYITIDNNIPYSFIGDDQRLAQVITNLLTNAVKFTPEEGTIYLDANFLSEENGICQLKIDVRDTGVGITDEQKSRLFTSFEQAESGTSRKFGGTGLGLAISKRIVELMGGNIWVESEPNVGSTFSFIVNLERGKDKPKNTTIKEIDYNKLNIFVVDDELEIREFFKDISNNIGMSCDVAGSGEEALEYLNNDYDMYFVDWKLPGMNGSELAKQIYSKKSHNAIVIIFSAADWSDIEDDARTAGVDKFIPKPLFQSTIVDVINESLGIIIENSPENEDYDCNYDNFSSHTILLAEDVEINREIVITLLEPMKLHIECAENGLEALNMLKENPDKYDMVFMDVQMPEMDGYEATRAIRELDSDIAKDIPIVAMTANVFKEDIEKCLEVGMNDHIGKPINFDELKEKIRKYLEI